MVVAAIEAADLVFAVDSVRRYSPSAATRSSSTPATPSRSSACGRCTSLLAGLLEKVHYLGNGLAVILAVIGVKLALQASHKVISTCIPEIPSPASLAVIVVVLTGSIVRSLRRPESEGANDPPPAHVHQA